jgi:hypothetical protein
MAQMGRPTKYDAERCPEVALSLSRKGATNLEVAAELGINIDTLKQWRKTYPDFSAALKEGKAVSDAKVEKSLYKRANGYDIDIEETTEYPDGSIQIKRSKKHIPPDTTAQIYWLKNRNPVEWRDRKEIEHTGKDGGPIRVVKAEELSDDELASIATSGGK